MSREKTTDEMREEFLTHVWHMVQYWSDLDMSEREKLEGLAFSILSSIDGSSAAVPGYYMIPVSGEEDKKDLIENDENYYPIQDEKHVVADIAGPLHEYFQEVGIKTGFAKN